MRPFPSLQTRRTVRPSFAVSGNVQLALHRHEHLGLLGARHEGSLDGQAATVAVVIASAGQGDHGNSAAEHREQDREDGPFPSVVHPAQLGKLQVTARVLRRLFATRRSTSAT